MKEILRFPSHLEGAIISHTNKRNAKLIFFFDETNVVFKYYGVDLGNFYWENCWDCEHRQYNKCIGGLKIYQEDKCKNSISNTTIQYLERNIPKHIWVYLGGTDYYKMFVPINDDEVIPFTISNVHNYNGNFCLGELDGSANPIDMYNSFFDCTRNGDYNPYFIEDEYKLYRPKLYDLIRDWSIEKICTSEDFEYYDEDNYDSDYLTQIINFNNDYLSNDVEVLDLDKTYYITDEYQENCFCLREGYYIGVEE